MFVGVIMNNDKNTINILKTSIAVFSLLSIFNFIGIAGSSYALYNKTADSKNFFILKTTTKKYCKSESCDFDYTGDEQMFVAPKTGTYKLETWGGQGGGNSTYYGGFGGYSVGTIYLSKGKKVYLNIGGKGKYTNVRKNTIAGGYNGGGNAKLLDNYGEGMIGSGGGATHISFYSGLLSSLNSNKEKIILVAGGGGGGVLTNDVNYGAGGSGGGFQGQNAVDLGARDFKDNGGYRALGGTQTDGANFGKGADGSTLGSIGGYPGYGSGGGGGYYGGNSNNIESAGGGSGYIGNSSLTNKHMACYDCETSYEESIKTISVTCASETPTTDCAKIGNGYARITYLGN